MKTISFVLSVVLLFLMSCTQNTCLVKGKIKGLEDGVELQLYEDNGQLLELLSSGTVKGEVFSFKVPLQHDGPKQFKLYGRTEQGFPNQVLDIWCAPGKEVKVTGDHKLIGSWRVESDIQEQQDQNQYVDATYEWIQAKERLFIKSEELRAFAKANLQTITDSEKEKLIAKNDRLEAQIDSIDILIDQKIMELMQTSVVGKVWLNQMYDLAFDCRHLNRFPYRKEVVALYARLTDEQKQSLQGKVIKTNLFPPEVVQVGDQAADADLYDLKGQIHHLADYRGKFVLLDFWSCGCGPCMEALPEIREVVAAHAEELVVVSLNVDDEKNWKETSERENMTWENLNDMEGESGLYAKYQIGGLPLYVIISPEGKVIHRWNGYGKGIIELNLIRQIDRVNCVMAVEQLENGDKVVKYPNVQPESTNTLAIDKVVMNDTATVIYMRAYYLPHYWILISADSKLVTADGSQIGIIKAEGIALGEQFTMPADGKAAFTLTFGPLPVHAKSFDFIEGDGQDCFKLLGVALE